MERWNHRKCQVTAIGERTFCKVRGADQFISRHLRTVSPVDRAAAPQCLKSQRIDPGLVFEGTGRARFLGRTIKVVVILEFTEVATDLPPASTRILSMIREQQRRLRIIGFGKTRKTRVSAGPAVKLVLIGDNRISPCARGRSLQVHVIALEAVITVRQATIALGSRE